jgi:adenosylcobinamide kinase/adenosylcobinamide-phosphate guanylyltransferase
MRTENKITLILGGARSGKSSYAQSLAEESGKSVTFIATAQALDDEMSARIQKHRSERPANWETLEIPFEIAAHMRQIKSNIVVLDCITLLISNLLMQFVKEDLVDETPFRMAVQKEINELIVTLRVRDQAGVG